MTLFRVRTASLTALLLALALPTHAELRLRDPIPVGPQVKVGQLANGLRYYLQKNGKPENKIELRLVVKAGSILEDEDQQGLAHFTEHMAFNGSTHFKKHELVSYLQSIGIKFGADLNAYTSFDETVYILPIPTDKKENFETGLLVLEDWAGGLTMNDADIDKERDIVLEELRLGKGASDRMNKVLLPKLFNGSRYAERLPIGQEDTLKHFKHEAIKRFYRDWYRPDLMAVVVVGDIDPQQAERMLTAHFSKLKNPPHERVREYAKVPVRADSEALVITDKEASSNAVFVRYPVQTARDEITLGDYREHMVDNLFSSMLAQRLQELTQLPEPPFMGASSGSGKLVRGYKSFSAYAVLGKGGAAPAVAALIAEDEKARQFGFGAAELERSKKAMMRGYERAYSERDKTDSSSYVGEYLRHFLELESIPGIAAEYGYAQQLLPGITLDEINAYARATIPNKTAKLVAFLGSTTAEPAIPSGGALMAMVETAEKTAVLAHTEKAVAASLMEHAPAPGTIVSETKNAALGLTEWRLSNGVRVVLKPTDFKNDQVLMGASRFGGQLLFGDKDSFNARYANAIAATMGLKDFSPLDLQKILAGKVASVRAGMGNYSDSVGGSAGSSDIETMLQLVHLQFSDVRKNPDLYQSFIGTQRELARNAMARPESVFSDAIIGALYNNHPRVARVARPDDFDQLSLERSLDIYRERFGSARDFTFFFVGSFELDQIKPLVATYLASLPTPDIATAWKDIGIRPVHGVVKKEVRSGSEAKSNVSINFTGQAPYSEAEQLRFHAMLEVLNIKITEVLREKLTLIYGGGLHGSVSKIPYGNYSIGLSLPCGPENVDKVIAAAFAEIDKVKRDGPEQGDLDKVKKNWVQSHDKAMRENGYWLGRLQGALIDGSDPASILHYAKDVEAISAADLKEAARRYFDMNNYVQVVLSPEAKAPDARQALQQPGAALAH
ncbi:MAG: insulinase family protein [Pseudomonadota bacterium]